MTRLPEAALRRHRALILGALAALVALSWAWLWSGAGTGMAPTVTLTAFPVAGDAMAGFMDMSWNAQRFLLTLAMWWVMMVAMMLPSAAATILLFGRAAAHGSAAIRPATGVFLAGYLLVWGGFSLAAVLLQMLLEGVDLLAQMEMASKSRILSAALLIAAGLYQLSPLKQSCLRHCRSPAQFLSRNYRPGRAGALRMGALHGAFCLGCCWLLMALLFVGGIMNLLWIAALTLLVAAEKLLPLGNYLGKAAGLACFGWGIAIFAG